jgi:hypothetical protein
MYKLKEGKDGEQLKEYMKESQELNFAIFIA